MFVLWIIPSIDVLGTGNFKYKVSKVPSIVLSIQSLTGILVTFVQQILQYSMSQPCASGPQSIYRSRQYY
jgi:riboflavin transporter FmnP